MVAGLTELERRDVTLWRVFARYCEALDLGMTEAASELSAGFCRRLHDYEAACEETA